MERSIKPSKTHVILSKTHVILSKTHVILSEAKDLAFRNEILRLLRGLRMTFVISSAFALFLLLPASPASPITGKNLKIISVAYQQDFNPGDPVNFRITVQNNDSASQFAEVDVTLTNINNGISTTLTPVLTTNSNIASRGGMAVLTRSYTLSAGTYTVVFPLYDGNGVEVDRIRGRFPIHVGTETDSLRVFPETIQVGPIPPGRAMHPMPITVSWNFFRFDRLRQDQPFSIRIYTNNATRFRGIPGALRRSSPAGLVSHDGRYVIPLKVWNLNYGPDIQKTGWDAILAGPPPVDNDDFWIGPPLLEGHRNLGSASWVRVPDLLDMTADPVSWRRLIGQEPHDTRFVTDSNPTGDITLKNPFTFYLATDAGASAVEGTYSAMLVVELWNP